MTEPVAETPEAVETVDGKPAEQTAEQPERTPEQQIEHFKAEARKWEKRAQENKKALDEAGPKLAEYDREQAARMTELQRAQQETERWQNEATRMRTTAVSSRIQALAADFADPEDAVGARRRGKYIDAGGQIDDRAIQADIGELLAKKPHWRRPEPVAGEVKPRIPAPNAHQGSGQGGKSAADPRQEFAALLQGGMNR